MKNSVLDVLRGIIVPSPVEKAPPSDTHGHEDDTVQPKAKKTSPNSSKKTSKAKKKASRA
jgi:hypothetical protein